MKDMSKSETEWAVVRARRIHILRFCRLPLMVILLLVGVHAASVALELSGWSAPRVAQEVASADRVEDPPVSEPPISARQPDTKPQTPTAVDLAGAPQVNTPDQESSKQAPEEIAVIPDMPIAQMDQGEVDTSQVPQAGDSDSVTADQATGAAKEVLRNGQSWAERELAGAMIDARGLADSSLLRLGKKISRISDGLVEMARAPEVSPGDSENTTASPHGPTAPPENAVLLNPADSGGAVHYLVNGKAHALKPGETQDLGPGDSWSIQFHCGADFGNAEHTIARGDYAFQITESGWDLQKTSLRDLPKSHQD